MKFGYFDDKNREYVITSPKTPYPWINYLGTQGFFSLISNTAGGYCFYKDARLRRITRYRYNNVPVDMGGRYFYINDGGHVWNPGWSPVKTTLDSYECRHGMGYTIIKGSSNGVIATVTFFVPQNFNGEIQKVTIKNDSDKEKNLKLFSFLEWCLWDANDDTTNFQRNFNTGEVEIDGSVIYHKTEYKERRDHYAFYSVNAPINGYDTDRESFLGLYNGFDAPQTVFAGAPNMSVADGWSPVASHYIEIKLQPGESKDLVFCLGYVENKFEEKFAPDLDENSTIITSGDRKKNIVNKAKAQAMMAMCDTAEKADKLLDELKAHWNSLLGQYSVNSPDEKLNRMVNIWNQYQCMVKKDDDIVVEIDPGTAFGSGSHETTKLCISQLKKYIKKDTELLDVGTGSGILSIIGLKLGAHHAMATDIDPNAIRATDENFAINGVAGQAEVQQVNILDQDEADRFYEKNNGKRYDVVVANILADVIIPLSGIVTPLLKEDGIFITSGIINTMEEAVKEAMLANNFEILEINHMKDWVSITAKPKR